MQQAEKILFTLPPHNGRRTSIAAARAIVPHLGRLQADIAIYVKDRGETGATRSEIEAGLGLNGSTVRPRVLELIERGILRETDTQRKTSTGRCAVVLRYVGADTGE